MSLTTQPPPPAEIAKPTGSALRVLVVDDNLDAANALKMLVEEAGHLVRMAHTGHSALAAALDYRPDVMLLDIGLPELDGFEVVKRRQQQALKPLDPAMGRNGAIHQATPHATGDGSGVPLLFC